MSSETKRGTTELSLELAHEKRARERAVAETDQQRRLARSFASLTTAIGSDTLDELLQKLPGVFTDASRFTVAVIRLREGTALRSRSAVGLEEEVLSGFTIPVERSFAAEAGTEPRPILGSVPADAPARSDCMRNKGVRALYAVRLAHGDKLVGALYLGTRGDHELTEDDQQLVVALAGPAAAAIARWIALQALQQAVFSRDEVMAVVAHDLRNPLSVISVSANSLMVGLANPWARRPLDRIIRGAQRADRIVQSLLEISSIEMGQFSIETRPVEVTDLILAATESQLGAAAEASVIVSMDLSPGLPPLEADEQRLLEVLENLIGNSLKFTAAGGSITVGASLQGDETLISVKDTGCGIAEDQLPHIFDRFWQAKKKARRGSGLGLTICKAVVEAHKGRIWAESAPGVGTTIFFTIPTAAAASLEAEPPSVANILLVDDRPENLVTLTAILERPDYRLVTASSGEEALRRALGEQFSVALIDIAMPGMTGLEVAGHLKELERSRDIPIIFVTAFGDDAEQIHRAYSAGAADYLVKPLDAEIVRKKVAVFVALGRRRLEN